MRNKIFTKIIITTLLVAFLTFNVGKVTSVSAVGTTAAIAGTAFVITGAIYISYICLTQGQVALPAAENLHGWLGDIGRKVTQYPSGVAAYQDVYQGLLKDPTANVIDGVWTWTQDRIKSFVNDFSDTRIIQDITSYEQLRDTVPAWLPFDYAFSYSAPATNVRLDGNDFYPMPSNVSFYTGARAIIYPSNGYACVVPTELNYPTMRNVVNNGRYSIQYLDGDTWRNISSFYFGVTNHFYTVNLRDGAWYYNGPLYNGAGGYTISNTLNYPVLCDMPLYNVQTGETTEVIPQEATEVVKTPQWLDPDNENRPIVPWVPIPDIPTGVPVPPGYTGPPSWGFPLSELLDLLEELAEGLIKIDAIARLINEFAGQHGDNYYLEYNDGDTNYYTYYQPTVFDNDTEYVTYNINVSEQEDVIPVDLNTISLYTQNRYLEQIKNSAVAGSSMLRDIAVFWHDVDPEITYIVLGCCILVLIGAFTGKLGHS